MWPASVRRKQLEVIRRTCTMLFPMPMCATIVIACCVFAKTVHLSLQICRLPACHMVHVWILDVMCICKNCILLRASSWYITLLSFKCRSIGACCWTRGARANVTRHATLCRVARFAVEIECSKLEADLGSLSFCPARHDMPSSRFFLGGEQTSHAKKCLGGGASWTQI